MEKQKLREEVSSEYKWDLTPIYANDDDWETDLKKLKKEMLKINDFHNFIEDAESLYNFLKFDEKIERLLNRLYYYAHLNFDADTLNDKYQMMNGQILDIMHNYEELSSFVTPTFLKVDFEIIKKYIKEKPELKEYEFTLEQIYRYKNHTLDEIQEKMLSLFGKNLSNPSETFESLTDSDLTFGEIKDEDGNEIELTESNYGKYVSSFDSNVRKQAFEKLFSTYKNFKTTITTIYNGDIDANINLAKVRKYPSALEASLYSDNVNVSVYNNLIETVHKNLDALYKYYDLKKEVLKLDKLHIYDIYTPMIKVDKQDYSFEESKELVLKAIEPLGEDYKKIIEKAFNEKWIDVYNNKGKRTGAYSSGFYDTNPYILLNFEGKINDVFTLAHELGHSVHTYLSCKNNPYNLSGYKIFVAEVASTVNELLLAKYLLKTSNLKEEKLNILNRLLDLFKGTIFRQTMFAEFEKNMYELKESGNVLTSEVLCNEYYKLNELYYGNNVVVDDLIRYEWERIPHFYYNFYVYKYATGLSAACYIAENILSNKENAVENYIKFLSSGGSMYPIDELKIAGVDMNSPEVVESAINMFRDTMEEFKTLIRK